MRLAPFVVALAGALLAAACDDAPVLATDHPTRQKTLGERLVGFARVSGSMSAEHKADLALALREASLPMLSGRLRLLVAEDDDEIATGASVALARTIHRREHAQGLAECWRDDTNGHLRAACALLLAESAPAALAALRAQVAASKSPAMAARAAELNVPAAAPEPARQVRPMLEADEPATRREALRYLLRQPSAIAEGLENPVLKLVDDRDAQVSLLAAAVVLRKSIAESAPPESSAIPDSRLP